MLDEWFDEFKASIALLAMAAALLVGGAGTLFVLLTQEDDFSCPGSGDPDTQLQKSLDSILGQFEKWERASDGTWRRERPAGANRRDVYRLEEHGGDTYIVLRGTSTGGDTDEDDWLVIDSWCTTSEFLESQPDVAVEAARTGRTTTTTTRPGATTTTRPGATTTTRPGATTTTRAR